MLLDFLFPKTCVGCGRRGVYFCSSCIARFSLVLPICPMCGKSAIGGITHASCSRPLGLDGLAALFSYRDSIKVAVKRLKYRFVREMGGGFVEAAMLHTDPDLIAFFRREAYIVVPVPLHRKRERWRGFNQAVLLGELLAGRLELAFVDRLKRSKDTKALAEIRTRLSRSERAEFDKRYPSTTQRRLVERKFLSQKKSKLRAKEMRGAFEVKNSKLKIQSQKILLVDDVWTSGATMTECAKVLKRAGAENVWGFAFARGS